MNVKNSLFLLLSFSLAFAPLINCETDDFDGDEGVTVEDDIVS